MNTTDINGSPDAEDGVFMTGDINGPTITWVQTQSGPAQPSPTWSKIQ